jgi:hypothetical protein
MSDLGNIEAEVLEEVLRTRTTDTQIFMLSKPQSGRPGG